MTTKLVTFSRPAVVSTLAEVSLMLDETKTLLARLQASMLCDHVAAYAAHHRVCAACGVLQPLKDRCARQLQALFGTVAVEALRFKLCRFRPSAPTAVARTVSPVCALLPTSPANQASVRTRTHAVALRIEAADRQAATEVTDGDPALPALVRSATGGPKEAILDWFLFSMRVRHPVRQ